MSLFIEGESQIKNDIKNQPAVAGPRFFTDD